jgi:thimet oligopeptidase
MRRAGAELSAADQRAARALREGIVKLSQDYARNLRNDVRTVELEPGELEGLAPDYVAAHPAGPDGRIRITTDPPDTTPVVLYARRGSARKKVLEAMEARAPANLAVFAELRAKRHQLARLLGYGSWADYNTEDKMTGSAGAVRDFLARVAEVAREPLQRDLGELIAEKRKDEPGADLAMWDWRHYLQRVRTKRYGYDAREVRPYFEYRTVRQFILDLNGELFGLTFEPAASFEPWHPAVETFAVKVEGELRGYISLDMHPREGKNKWFYCTTKVPGIAGRQLHHGVLVCNFPDPAAVRGPALMDHTEVVTYFHEFGHLVHGIASGSARWIRLMRPAESDVMEAPSRFLEEYIFDGAVLSRFARHVETGAPIPADLVKRLRGARDFGRAVIAQNSVYLASLALLLHDREPEQIDARKAARELRERYLPLREVEGSNFPVNWEHMSNEAYSASYYTYLWSDVIARDLYTRFARGLLDKEEARRYFTLLLAQGGRKPAAEIVANFLGRPYSFDAFERWMRGDAGTTDRA